MCDVLDRIETRGIQQGMKQGIQQGMQQGMKQGMQQGERTFALLMQILFSQGRLEDARLAAEDQEFRHKLMRELSIPR